MRIKKTYLDNFGIILLIFSILFSFFFSLVYTLDGSQYDYLYYMQLIDEGNYKESAMCGGSLFSYKPLSILFGKSFFLWNRFHWVLNIITIFIPYLFLLNSEQRKRYAFAQALAVLLFCVTRCGCEPPRLVLPCAIISICLFVKYAINHNTKLLWGISLLLSLIAFFRFPSLFVYPLFVVAVFLIAKNKRDGFITMTLPVVFFCLLVTQTNGNIISYIESLRNGVSNTSSLSPSHSMSAIFMSEVESVLELMYFSIVAVIPFLLLLWKKKNKVWWIASPVILLLMLNLIRINPIPRWACAIIFVLCFFFIFENKFSRESLACSLLISFVPMITSVGSNCGFGYDYVSVAFLPFMAIKMKSIYLEEEYFSIDSFHLPFKKGLLYPAFYIVVFVLFASNLNVRFKNIREAFIYNGSVSLVNGERLSPNLKNIYFSEGAIMPLLEAENEYSQLSTRNADVIFWGMDAHVMSFANEKWPITDLWKISSVDGDNAAMYDLDEYVKKYRPIVIDMEKLENTNKLLTSIGYQRIVKNNYIIYK